MTVMAGAHVGAGGLALGRGTACQIRRSASISAAETATAVNLDVKDASTSAFAAPAGATRVVAAEIDFTFLGATATTNSFSCKLIVSFTEIPNAKGAVELQSETVDFNAIGTLASMFEMRRQPRFYNLDIPIVGSAAPKVTAYVTAVGTVPSSFLLRAIVALYYQ